VKIRTNRREGQSPTMRHFSWNEDRRHRDAPVRGENAPRV
jgi:hypothetical protein